MDVPGESPLETSLRSNDSLYERLEPITDFEAQIFDDRYYVEPPNDWYVVVADIESSTRAVNDGRYTDVNYVGAACIAAVRNNVVQTQIPATFGGDGAVFVVPASTLQQVNDALLSSMRWARDSFGLDLRVGAVCVGELRKLGAELSVAKLQLSPGNCMAMFKGNALSVADALIKAPESVYRINAVDKEMSEPDLTGLSCRWAPLSPIRGVIYCLIVGLPSAADGVQTKGAERSTAEAGLDTDDSKTRADFADEIYRKVLLRIVQIVGSSQGRLNPVRVEGLRFAPDFAKMYREVLSSRHFHLYAWLHTIVVALLGRLMFSTGMTLAGLDPERYKEEMAANSDFRRLSGELKLVVDISSQQADEIDDYLQALYRSGDIVFGSHRAKKAVMTCIASNPADSEHVHYVDGSEGGLWCAADAMKRRKLVKPCDR